MASKEWWQDAEYCHSATPKDGITEIQFSFPNAIPEPLIFSTWLYKSKDGEVIGKNLEAEMLQCYIDRDLINNRNAIHD